MKLDLLCVLAVNQNWSLGFGVLDVSRFGANHNVMQQGSHACLTSECAMSQSDMVHIPMLIRLTESYLKVEWVVTCLV